MLNKTIPSFLPIEKTAYIMAFDTPVIRKPIQRMAPPRCFEPVMQAWYGLSQILSQFANPTANVKYLNRFQTYINNVKTNNYMQYTGYYDKPINVLLNKIKNTTKHTHQITNNP